MAEEKSIQVQEGKSPAGAERTRMRRIFAPDVDIYEKADSYILLADMPGTDEKSININLENSVLTIMGTMAVERVATQGI